MSSIPSRHGLIEEPNIQFSNWLATGVLVFTLLQAELQRWGVLNKYLSLMPEFIGGVILAMIMLSAGRLGGPRLAPAYWVVFAVMCLHILLGTAFNEANIGSVITSLRYYVRWLPLFLLPVFFGVSDAALRLQLKLVAVIALMQIPVALIQRFVLGWGSMSGDMVRGTMPNSASLSIFLASVIAVWAATYTKGIQSATKTAWFCGLVMVPMTLNESKGAFILVPTAIFVVSLAYGNAHERLRKLLWAVVATSIFLTMYVPIYNAFSDKGGILVFFTEGRIVHYLAGNAMGNENRFGRIDGLIAPVQSHAEEGPITLAFGLGAGAVSESFFGGGFDGDHYEEKGALVYAQASRLLWELGFLGVFGLFVILGLIYRDALTLKATEDIHGVLGLGWVGVLVVIALSTFYSELMSKEAISYSFWYFSGVVAARAYMVRSDRRLVAMVS